MVSPKRSYFLECFTFDAFAPDSARLTLGNASFSFIFFTLVHKCEVGGLFKLLGTGRKVSLGMMRGILHHLPV